MAVTDTSPEAEATQIRLYREAGTSRRAEIAVELSEAVRLTTLDGIRRRHPEYSDAEVRREFLAIVYGHPVRR